MTTIQEWRPIRTIAYHPEVREEVVAARKRVLLKRYLRKRGHDFDAFFSLSMLRMLGRSERFIEWLENAYGIA